MDKSLFSPDLFLVHSRALADAPDTATMAKILAASLAQWADHSTVFLYEYQEGHTALPLMAEVVATQDRTGQELLPLRGRYLWADFPLRTVAPPSEAGWQPLDLAALPPGGSAWLNDLLHLRQAIVTPLRVKEQSIGFILLGWRGTPLPPPDFSPFTQALAAQASGLFSHQRQIEISSRALIDAQMAISFERLFRNLIENAGDAIDIMELDGVSIYVNQAFATLYGFASVHNAMLGVDPLRLTAPEDRERFTTECLPQAHAGIWRGSLRRLRQDGTPFIAALTMFNVSDPTGELSGIATIARDESEHLQLEQSLREQAQLRGEIITVQSQLIQKLSTPTIPVTDQILVMPLIGHIDPQRAAGITRALLAGISEHHAKMVILDITGVPVVDDEIAQHLHKTILAARLKGAQTIVTGITETVAETIVDLGIDWSGIKTLTNLQAGIRYALEQTGRHIAAIETQ